VGWVDDVVASVSVVVVPFNSNLITTVDGNGLGSLDAGYIALHRLGGDINDGVVVGRRVNVSTSNISETLGLSVDRNAVNSGVGASSTSKSESED